MRKLRQKVRRAGGKVWRRLARAGLVRQRPRRIETFDFPDENTGVVPAYGPELDALVRGAEALEPEFRWRDQYDTVKAHFDTAFYLARHPDIARLRMDPVAHYLKAGAREGRDPTPWFSSKEYRRAYMAPNRGTDLVPDPRMNAFYHYLTIGRANGFAARAPNGYTRFADSLGLTEAEVADRARARIEDVRARLANGTLGEMVKKAAALDPLVAKSWPAATNVRVPPATNGLGVRRIAHYLDLSEQAETRRARLVIVTDQVQGKSPHDLLRVLLRDLTTQVSAREIVVISIRKPTAELPEEMADIRVLDFSRERPGGRGYDSQRTLVEIIRALWPDTVINLGATMFWNALPTYGRALAASSRIAHVLHVDPLDFTPRDTETVLARFYRGFDMGGDLVPVGAGLKTRLQDQFAVPAALADNIEALHPSLASGEVTDPDDGSRNRLIWISPNNTRARSVLDGIATRAPGLEIVGYDPDLGPKRAREGHWGPLPVEPMDFTGVHALVVPQRIDVLEGMFLDAVAAGVPIAICPDPGADPVLAENVVALNSPEDATAILTDLAPVLDRAPDLYDRAAALRAHLSDRAAANAALLDRLTAPRPQPEETAS